LKTTEVIIDRIKGVPSRRYTGYKIYYYYFDVNGEKYEGKSYARIYPDKKKKKKRGYGYKYDLGTKAEIEYREDNPEISRIVGEHYALPIVPGFGIFFLFLIYVAAIVKITSWNPSALREEDEESD